MDGRLFLAYPHDSGALSQSVDKLQLFDDGGSDLVSVSFIFVCRFLNEKTSSFSSSQPSEPPGGWLCHSLEAPPPLL